MPKVRPNPSVGALQGKLGGLIYAIRADGEVIVRRAPDYHPEPTPARRANQSRFAQATLYVEGLKAQPERYAAYKRAAKAKQKRACNLAMADYLRPPAIQEIDPSAYAGFAGQAIRVQATDDFEVSHVEVLIKSESGVVLEQGVAALDDANAGQWLYRTMADVSPGQTVTIEATALDRAGNRAAKTLRHSLPAVL